MPAGRQVVKWFTKSLRHYSIFTFPIFPTMEEHWMYRALLGDSLAYILHPCTCSLNVLRIVCYQHKLNTLWHFISSNPDSKLCLHFWGHPYRHTMLVQLIWTNIWENNFLQNGRAHFQHVSILNTHQWRQWELSPAIYREDHSDFSVWQTDSNLLFGGQEEIKQNGN